MTVSDIEDARSKRDAKALADGLLDHLGVDADGLAMLCDTAPAEIRTAVLDALVRGEMYYAHAQASAAAQEAAGVPADRCLNMVCPHYKQADWEKSDDGSIRPVGPMNRCTLGGIEAQGCLFRMLETPPNDLAVPGMPSHAEAIRMLQRAGLVGDSGDPSSHDGTDFWRAWRTERLWRAYLALLVETGRVPSGLDAGAEMERGLEVFRASCGK